MLCRLAQRIVRGDVPDSLQNRKVSFQTYFLDRDVYYPHHAKFSN